MNDCCNVSNNGFDCNCLLWIIIAIIVVLLLTNNTGCICNDRGCC